MERDEFLRKHLADMFRKGRLSHTELEEMSEGFPARQRGVVPDGLPYSAWMVLEHARSVQHDFLESCRDKDYVSPEWPEGFWPKDPKPPRGGWDASVASFRADMTAMADMIADPRTDMLALIPWVEGYTRLRLALLAADHNAYHLGQLLVIKRLLGKKQP